MTVYLVLFKDTMFSLGGKLHSSIQQFINENYADAQQTRVSQLEIEALRETASPDRMPLDRQVFIEKFTESPESLHSISIDKRKLFQ